MVIEKTLGPSANLNLLKMFDRIPLVAALHKWVEMQYSVVAVSCTCERN